MGSDHGVHMKFRVRSTQLIQQKSQTQYNWYYSNQWILILDGVSLPLKPVILIPSPFHSHILNAQTKLTLIESEECPYSHTSHTQATVFILYVRWFFKEYSLRPASDTELNKMLGVWYYRISWDDGGEQR